MSMGDGTAPQFGERAEPGPDDFCYRHKDRPSFTLCQRCGRTICPDCQTVSPVGVLCADCMRAAQPKTAAKASRAARVTARKLGDSDRPVVTYAIIIICAVVFVAQMIGHWAFTNPQTGVDPVTGALWYAPLHSLPPGFSADGYQPWRMLTAMFTHSTGFLLHILFNMYALWLFGPGLERMLGRVWFSVLYLLSGLGGSLAVMLWVYVAPNPIAALGTATVGASGAIFGLLTATLVAFRVHRVNITSLAVLIAINFAIGLFGGSISWQAHLGGMIVGALAMWLLLLTRGPRRRGARIGAILALTAVLIAASFAFFVVLPPPLG